MGKQFSGSTEQATSLVLGAERWKVGLRIAGVVQRTWQSQNGPLCAILLKEPITIDKEKHTRVSVGMLKGLNMAIQASGVGEDITFLQPNDAVMIECTGFKKSEDPSKNDMVEFKVAVNRP